MVIRLVLQICGTVATQVFIQPRTPNPAPPNGAKVRESRNWPARERTSGGGDGNGSTGCARGTLHVAVPSAPSVTHASMSPAAPTRMARASDSCTMGSGRRPVGVIAHVEPRVTTISTMSGVWLRATNSSGEAMSTTRLACSKVSGCGHIAQLAGVGGARVISCVGMVLAVVGVGWPGFVTVDARTIYSTRVDCLAFLSGDGGL